jgi:L-aspartate oxidase
VYLDARGIEADRGAGFLGRRFPTITAATLAAGYDWTTETVPVSPAAHYWMGGVSTDLRGRTSVPGLYAAGEVARTGAQGANRLASNSLLEGLVFGRRAVEDFLRAPVPETAWLPPAREDLHPDNHVPPAAALTPKTGAAEVPFSRAALGRLMTAAAGVTRAGAGLDAAAAQLAQWAAALAAADFEAADLEAADLEIGVRAGLGAWHSAGRSVWLRQDAHEDRNLLLAAELLVAAARQRTHSVGAHYRADTAGAAVGGNPDTVGQVVTAHQADTAHPDRTAQPAGTAMQPGPAPMTSGGRHPAAARSMQRI